MDSTHARRSSRPSKLTTRALGIPAFVAAARFRLESEKFGELFVCQ